MNPLIGVAAGIVPDIIKLIAGDKTGQLADQVGKAVADAVGTTDAGAAHTTIARTAPAISYLVIGGFFIFLFVLVWLYWWGPSPGKNDFVVQIINIVVGALTAAFATVVNFWLGSSAGSQKKDDTNLTLQQAQAERTDANLKALQDKIAPSPQPVIQTPAPVQGPAP